MHDYPRHSPHDHFVRRVFSQPKAAAALFRFALPPGNEHEIHADLIKPIPNDKIGPEFEESRGDLLFRLHLPDEDAYALLMLEHQSSYDPWMAYRLLHYKMAAWGHARRESPQLRFPPILALVLYHGRRPWGGEQRYRELFSEAALKPQWRDTIPDFRYQLVDLARRSDEEIHSLADRGEADAGLSLLGLKWSREPDLLNRLGLWLERPGQGSSPDEELRAWRELAVYLSYSSDVAAEQLASVFRNAARKEHQDMGKTVAEQLMEQGEARALEIIRRPLIARLEFEQALTAEREEAVRNASAERLRSWIEATIEGRRLAELIDAD